MLPIIKIYVVNESQHPVQLIYRAGTLLKRYYTRFFHLSPNLKAAGFQQRVNHGPDIVAVILPNIDSAVDGEPRDILA